MGTIDDYVRAQTEPNLRPGEVIKGIGYGLVFKPARGGGVEGDPIHYLVAATDQRLVLFKSFAKKSVMGVRELVATHSETEVWEYADLAKVEVGRAMGGEVHGAARLELYPQWGKGPRWQHDEHEELRALRSRRTIFLAKPDFDLPDQPRLRDQFGPWLSQQVAAGAFTGGVAPPVPTPPPVAAPTTPTGPKPPTKSKAHLGVGCLGLMLMLGVLGGAGYAYDLGDRADDTELRAQGSEVRARSTPDDFEARVLRGTAEEQRDYADGLRGEQKIAGAAACLGSFFALGVLAAAVFLSIRGGKKHQQALAEHAARTGA